MEQYKKFGLVAGQVFLGLGFALAGAIVVSILVYLYTELMKIHLDLYGGIMYALIGSYIGMQMGIAFDGFKYLKQNNRQKDFLRFFLQSVAGLICGLVGLFVIIIPIGETIPHALTNFLAITLPLIGSIIGFNFGLIPKG